MDTELSSACNRPEKQKGPGVRGRVQSPMPLLFQGALPLRWLSRNGRRKGTGAVPGSPPRLQRLPRVTPALPSRPSPQSGLVQTQGFPLSHIPAIPQQSKWQILTREVPELVNSLLVGCLIEVVAFS